MKRLNILLPVAIMLLITACTALPTQSIPPNNTQAPINTENPIVPTFTETSISQPTQMSLDQFRNMVINAPELKKDVQLTDGKWSENQSDGSIQTVNLDDHFAVGDLNSDEIQDAAFLIAESMGGTGVFYSIIAMVNENGSYQQTNSKSVDDRPIIHSMEIINGEIILNATIHGPNDAMVDPTLNVTKTYRIYNGRLILWSQTQLLADGKVRSINIESPIDYAEASGEVVLSGNMPIAPFENTLLLQIYGEFTMTNSSNSIMVTSPDVGMPATFSTTILLGMFKPGELVRIQLVEVSMADGSPMAIDTVVVKVK